MSDKPLNEVHSRNGFGDELIIIMTIVVKGDSIILFVIGVNARSGNDRPSEISADVIKNLVRITFAGFQVNIEPIFGMLVYFCFDPLKFRGQLLLKEVQENGLKSITEELVIEMSNRTPEAVLVKCSL